MPFSLNHYHTVPGTPSSSNMSLGLNAFLWVWGFGILTLAIIIHGEIFFPCDTGLGTGLGPYGCDTKEANDQRFYQSLSSMFFLIALPVSFVRGLMAMSKQDGPGWGALALIPLPLVILISFIGYGISKASQY